MLIRSAAPMLAFMMTALSFGGHAFADVGDLIRRLIPADNEWGDGFGCAVAIDGDWLIVGANGDDDNGSDSGAAYVYRFNGSRWIISSKLLAEDGEPYDTFGGAVALHDTTAVIGAHLDDDHGSASGSAYLFDVTTGQQIAKLAPADTGSRAFFGRSVAIEGGTVIVGCPSDQDNGDDSGSAYLFDAVTGEQLAKLLPDDGAMHARFGCSVGISGNTVVVGAYGDPTLRAGGGAAYLFDVGSGEQIAKIVPNDLHRAQWFGYSVDISGDTIVIGAAGDNRASHKAGAAYLFDARTLKQLAKMTPPPGAIYRQFGGRVAIDGAIAIVGPSDIDYRNQTMPCVLYNARTGAEIASLAPPRYKKTDWYGWSVDVSEKTAIIGAQGDRFQGFSSGAAYIYEAATDCLDLTVENLRFKDNVRFSVWRGTPGARTVVLWGIGGEPTSFINVNEWCATFGFDVVLDGSMIRIAASGLFDDRGRFSAERYVYVLIGTEVYFQAAERGTCPDECMSNLVEVVVQ